MELGRACPLGEHSVFRIPCPYAWQISSYRNSRPVRSGHAFAFRITGISAITAGPSLFRTSHTRIPIGLPYGRLSLIRERYGLTTFRLNNHRWVRFRLSAGTLVYVWGPLSPHNPVHTFFLGPSSSMRMSLSLLTTFISDSHMLTLPSAPLSRTSRIDVCGLFSREDLARAHSVPEASHIAITHNARSGRRLPIERQVYGFAWTFIQATFRVAPKR